jgi:hypothetical protein
VGAGGAAAAAEDSGTEVKPAAAAEAEDGGAGAAAGTGVALVSAAGATEGTLPPPNSCFLGFVLEGALREELAVRGRGEARWRERALVRRACARRRHAHNASKSNAPSLRPASSCRVTRRARVSTACRELWSTSCVGEGGGRARESACVAMVPLAPPLFPSCSARGGGFCECWDVDGGASASLSVVALDCVSCEGEGEAAAGESEEKGRELSSATCSQFALFFLGPRASSPPHTRTHNSSDTTPHDPQEPPSSVSQPHRSPQSTRPRENRHHFRSSPHAARAPLRPETGGAHAPVLRATTAPHARAPLCSLRERERERERRECVSGGEREENPSSREFPPRPHHEQPRRRPRRLGRRRLQL